LNLGLLILFWSIAVRVKNAGEVTATAPPDLIVDIQAGGELVTVLNLHIYVDFRLDGLFLGGFCIATAFPFLTNRGTMLVVLEG